METMPAAHQPRELPIVGGHLALDFANTVDDPEGPARHDHAATYDDLLRWAHRIGVLDERTTATLRRMAARRPADAAVAVRSAHELRDVLNDVFGGVVEGRCRRRGALAAAPAVRRRRRRAAATLDTRATALATRWRWPHADELTVVLHPVASAAAELLVGDDLRLVKRCARCPWLFLDRSKNHSRRWCDMNDCGTTVKMERYITRRAAARRAGRPSRRAP